MTKRHFIALADSLRGAELSQDMLDRLCTFMKQQNAQFNRVLWLNYLAGRCGPNGGKVKGAQHIV